MKLIFIVLDEWNRFVDAFDNFDAAAEFITSLPESDFITFNIERVPLKTKAKTNETERI